LDDSTPVVGLTVNWVPNDEPSRALYGNWRFFLNSSYSDLVERAGAQPVAILPSDPGALGAFFDRLDLVILTGGGDPDPALYGRRANGARSPERERPLWEMAVYREAISRRIPVLGICLGMQVMAMERGRALVQDIPRSGVEHEGTVEHPLEHEVRISSGSRLYAALGPGAVVASFHHQAVESAPDSFSVSARAADGVIEAMEGDDGLSTGVQWHPERDSTGLPILRLLLEGRPGR